MAVCGKDTYSTGIITALLTGVRIGELLGIMWKDMDFTKKTIHISRQVNRLKDYSENAKAKTRLGHANTSTTLNVYAHALKSKDLEAADKLEQALAI